MDARQKAVVRNWLERAEEANEAARQLFEKAHLAGCVSHLHRACFCGVTALLRCRSLSPRGHKGVRTVLHADLMRSGLISVDAAKYYDQMFEEGLRADHRDFVVFDPAEVKEWLEKAPTFLDEAEKAAAQFLDA